MTVLSQGPFFPSTVVNDAAAGTTPWSNPGNAVATDAAVAQCTTSGSSQYLKATDFTDFSLPDNAQILGIALHVLRRSQNSVREAEDEEIRLVKAGAIAGINLADPTETWPTSALAQKDYGGSSELWGLTWSPEEINAADFGVAIRADNVDSPGIAQVDSVAITVYYRVPDSPLTLARQAAWDALLNWDTFADDYFLRTYQFDGDSLPELNPQADQLPAIELYPVASTSKQYTHRQHEEILTLAFLIYTSGWNPAQPEFIAAEITKALWQSKPASGPTYIQAATGSHPQPSINKDFQRGHLPGNTKATLTTFEFQLKIKHDPLSS